MRKLGTLAASVFLLAAVFSCELAARDALKIAAAASLRASLAQVEQLFESENPEVDLVFVLGASGALATQIEHGAPIDVFLSAADEPLRLLGNAGALSSSGAKAFLSNRLVAVGGATRGARDLSAAVAAAKRIVIGEPRSVPVGARAQEVLNALQLWSSAEKKFIFAKDAQQAVVYAKSGEVDLAFVYASDAFGVRELEPAIAVSPALHAPILYSAAVIKRSDEPERAERFIAFLFRADVQAIFLCAGFSEMAAPAAARQ